MTRPTPVELLHGLAGPQRRRWQPLRAGIIGLFHFDEQIFSFHRGRLLLRGNNGSGKSMALEVLLPYVLDADLAPERLSTFGSQGRSMYLWLLGHDTNTDRTSARGYVWVEFGRRTDDGDEFQTIGAGLQASRSARSPTAWYFTTAARVGAMPDQLRLGGPGLEPLPQTQLRVALEELRQQGIAGLLHDTPGAHRREVNRVLFGLSGRQFDALRKTMLHLRKPKLSDKLSETKLAEVLRESLPPVDRSVTDELADGFERLDRHRETIKELGAAHDGLARLSRAYRAYAHAQIGLHAGKLRAAVAAVHIAETERGQAEQLLISSTTSLTDLVGDKKEQATTVRTITTDLGAIEGSALYKEGAQLEPLREKAHALKTAADMASSHARELREIADKRDYDANLATTKAEAEIEERSLRADTAERSSLALPDTLLWEATIGFIDGFADTDQPREHALGCLSSLRGKSRNALNGLDQLIRLADRSEAALEKAAGAAQNTLEAKNALVAAEAHVAEEQKRRQRTIAAFLTAVQDWIYTSPQLVLGAAPPELWMPDLCEKAVPEWATMARRNRDRQLTGALHQIEQARPAVSEICIDVTRLDGAVDNLRATAEQVWGTAHRLRDERIRFTAGVNEWSAGLLELPLGDQLPDFLATPDPAWLTLDEIRRWADVAHDKRARVLLQQEIPLRAELKANRSQHGATQAAYDILAAGGMPAPAVPDTRLADRAGRPGAAFYQLVDFAEGIESGMQASLEAALIGCGLADAWVSPDGSVATETNGAPLADVQLGATGRPAANPLTTALRPDSALFDGEGPVSPAVVTALLDQIELGDGAAADSRDGLIVGWDGSWSAGPLRGAYRKSSVEFIGATGREEHRRRRVTELGAELAALDDVRDQLRERIEANADAERRLASERETLPTDTLWRGLEQELTEDSSSLQHKSGSLSELVDAMTEKAGRALVAAKGALSGFTTGTGWTSLDFGPFALRVRETVALLVAEAATAASAVWSTSRSEQEPPLRGLTAELAEWSTRWELVGEALAEGVTALKRHTGELEAQAGQQPPSDEVFQARVAVRDAETLAGNEKTRLNKRRTIERKLSEDAQAAVLAIDTALELAHLAGRAAELPAFKTAIDTYRVATEDWINTSARACEAVIDAGVKTASAAESAVRAETAAGEAGAAAVDAQDAGRYYEQLNAQMGQPYQELMARRMRLEQRLDTAKTLLETLVARELELVKAVERDTGLVQTGKAKVAEKTTGLRAEAERFAVLHHCGLIANIDEAAAVSAPFVQGHTPLRPEQIHPVCEWAQTIAATLPKQQFEPHRIDSAQNRVSQLRHEVESGLAGQVIVRERVEQGVLIVTATRNGVESSVDAAAKALATERDRTESLLEQDESELFERFLSDEVRLEVGGRIQAALALLDRTNRLMTSHPTGSRLSFKLTWVGAKDSRMPDDMVSLLKKPSGTLWASERERLIEFYRKRISVARDKEAALPLRQQIARLLDYRLWYHFVLRVKRGDEEWADLNHRRHAQMSGGEKAVALHLPLFAAAATHCEASSLQVEEDGIIGPGCPRLILLDEVFAGVDPGNRGELFDLIRRLDLDLVATSESEKGLYPQLDGLSIYNLVVDEGLDGVLAARSVWDGRDEHDLLEHDMLDLL